MEGLVGRAVVEGAMRSSVTLNPCTLGTFKSFTICALNVGPAIVDYMSAVCYQIKIDTGMKEYCRNGTPTNNLRGNGESTAELFLSLGIFFIF